MALLERRLIAEGKKTALHLRTKRRLSFGEGEKRFQASRSIKKRKVDEASASTRRGRNGVLGGRTVLSSRRKTS